METFVRGDIVVIPFPFSDLSHAKRKPACVVRVLDHHELILCQITSNKPVDRFHVCIEEVDFSQGSLSQTSYVRYHHIFTADAAIVLYKIAKLKPKKTQQILNELANLFGK
ncbi:type II toxin-antitoxin system PemK/MazF family toxin [bacterium]|nr:type II toxin-antitoxin system PemK/MazF family toxin [bacterium]